MIKNIEKHHVCITFVLLSASTVFLFDVLTPASILHGIPYAIVILMAMYLPSRNCALYTAFLSSFFVILGLFLTPQSNNADIWTLCIERAIAIFIIALTVFFVLVVKRKEEIIKIKEKKYRDIVEQTNVISWEADINTFNFTYVSPQAERITGYSIDEWLQPGFWGEHLHQDDKEWAVKYCKECTINNEDHVFEYRLIKQNGDVIWLHDNVKVVRSNNESMLRGIMIDITNKKSIELDLIKNEEKFRAIFDSANEGIASCDMDGNLISMNKKYLDLIGYTEVEAKKLTYWDITPSEYEENEKHQLNSLLTTGKYGPYEKEYVHKDGRRIPVLLNGMLIKQDDKNIIWSMVQDISEQKIIKQKIQENEERFRSLFENVTVGNIVINKTGTIELFNAMAQKIFGYEAHEVIGKNVKILMPEPHKTEHDQYIKNYTDTHEAKIIGIGREVEGRKKDGSIFPLHLGIGEIKIDGKTSFIGTVTDLTEIKSMENQVMRTQKMDAIGQLTGGIAHDFNNILAIIHGNIEILEHHKIQDDRISKKLETIKKASFRASDLTKQLLDFSRDKLKHQESININNLINEIEHLITASLTPQFKIIYDLNEDIWLTEIDPGDLQDAIINMVINARDVLSDNGELHISTRNIQIDPNTISKFTNANAGDYVELSIKDNGTGMTPETIDRIYDPFYTTKEVGKGTGLGLSMVYGFVKRSQGIIDVKTKLNEGTTFYIYLPRSLKEEKDKPIENTDSFISLSSNSNEKVLIVDDETELCSIAKTSLEISRYEVYTANNAHQALEIIKKQPDLKVLVTDVVMPNSMNGYELAEAAADINPNLEILLVSGYRKNIEITDEQRKYNEHFLAKPYTQKSLLEYIKKLVNNSNKNKSSDDDLNSGIELLDSDHKKLGKLFSKCRAAIKADDENTCKKLLSHIRSNLEKHFPLEELAMSASDYPDYENHSKVHELLLEEIYKMKKQLIEGKMMAKDVLYFITDWWEEHLIQMDQPVTIHLRNNKNKVIEAINNSETIF